MLMSFAFTENQLRVNKIDQLLIVYGEIWSMKATMNLSNCAQYSGVISIENIVI